MTEQSVALQYATRLSEMRGSLFSDAAELRRLHEYVQELTEMLRKEVQHSSGLQHELNVFKSEVSDIVMATDEKEAVLRARIQELERYKKAWEEWQEKTDWVQATSRPKELGMHRADVLKLRIQELESEAEYNARILGASAEKELHLLSRIEELTKMLHNGVSS